jgi:hypothetical protein
VKYLRIRSGEDGIVAVVSDGVRRRRIVCLCGKRFFRDDLDFSENEISWNRPPTSTVAKISGQSELNKIYEY